MRSFVKIKEQTDASLHLVKETGLYGYALLTAFTAIGYGAASYSQDSYFWQTVYLTFGVFMGLACMEDYEECVFNKTDKDIRLTKQTVWDRILSVISQRPASVVVFNIEDVTGVHVKEETVTYFGKGYQVVLFMNSGIDVGVTDSFIFGRESSEHTKLADKIKEFLNLYQPPEGLSDHSSSDSGEDGFEHITDQVIEEELKKNQQ
ncbi:cytochrome b-245 chaperone 1-like [Mytilus edulis]|uniref:cytochrome b-245 chaperone 1-like n=1 Tax=Mytilus edulis TaxID=6550 RepID=UPI0039EE25BA